MGTPPTRRQLAAGATGGTYTMLIDALILTGLALLAVFAVLRWIDRR